MNKKQAVKQIKKLKKQDIDKLNDIANKCGISLGLALFYYHAINA